MDAALFLAGADLTLPTGFLGATWLTSPTKDPPPGGFAGALKWGTEIRIGRLVGDVSLAM